MKYNTIIFCDFDGTITKEETLEDFLSVFLGGNIREIGEELGLKGYSVKTGIQAMFSKITSKDYAKKTDYFNGLEIRSGFKEFLAKAKEKEVPIVVLSGGIYEMVEKTLLPYRADILDIYAAQVDQSGENVRLYSEYETKEELVGKSKIMKRYDYERSICIGDSYSDIIMAQHVDIVFARDRLAEAMSEEKKPYYPFETFYDIIKVLSEIL